MASEIERKFLVLNEHWRAHADAGAALRQGYLLGTNKASVRVRISGEQANLNIKSATLGIIRQAFKYPIPVSEATEILDTLAQKPLVEKIRYRVPHGKHAWEVDVFSGDNLGLVVAEIERASVDEIFARLDWLGEEVSASPRYYNACLVQHPYKNWCRDERQNHSGTA